LKQVFILLLATIVVFLPFDESAAGRKRISSIVNQDEYSTKDIEKEVIFGREMSALILANHKLIDNQPLSHYLNLVGNSILQHSTRQEIPFHFAVINSSVINAYATPGGYIFITIAALNQMENEAELAGVLAHEISHVTQRHIVKALKIKAEDDSVTGSVGRIIGSTGSSANVVFDQVVNKAIEILFSKGLKVEDEFNADEMGIILTSMAGYDPVAYYKYLERIKPLVEKGNGELNKTHPPLIIRLKKLQSFIDTEGLAELEGYINKTRFQINAKSSEKNL